MRRERTWRRMLGIQRILVRYGLDDLVLASFVSGPGSTTLPMEIFSAVRLGVKPEINAIASVIGWNVSRRKTPRGGYYTVATVYATMPDGTIISGSQSEFKHGQWIAFSPVRAAPAVLSHVPKR